MAIENKSGKCLLVIAVFVTVIFTHCYAFYRGTQCTITFKIESRESEITVDDKPNDLDETKRQKTSKSDIIDVKTFDALEDCIANKNCNQGY